MVKIKNSNAHGPLSLTRLNDFERRTHIRLPEEYRQFLMEHNGGQPEPAFFWITRPVDGSRVLRFYALFEGSLLPSLNAYAGPERYGIPESLLPIADDGLGNLICIGVTEPIYGAIFFLDHDLFSPNSADDSKGITRLSDSFNAFLQSLMENPTRGPDGR